MFPPVYRISIVAICTTKNMKCPSEPNTLFASWASTVGYPLLYGVAWVACASQEMPATRTPRIAPSAISTRRALGPSGGRKAPTASDTASMPVSEAPPLANARSKVKIITPVIRPDDPLPSS